MEAENTNLIELLLDKGKEYSKTSIELMKLKVIDKTSDLISSFIPHSIVFIIIASFILLFNLGLAFWLGEILGQISYGFFVVSAFYAVLGIFTHFFMQKWLKKLIGNYFINLLLK